MIIKKIMRSINIYLPRRSNLSLYYDVVVAEMINSIVLKAAEKHIKIKHVHNIAYRVYISDECSAVQCSSIFVLFVFILQSLRKLRIFLKKIQLGMRRVRIFPKVTHRQKKNN